jgi:predicted DNA-binding transcriptional regulator YafY
VKRRTIYEDIKILKEGLGLRINFDRLKNGYYNADPRKQLPNFELTPSEVGLLASCMRMFAYFVSDKVLLLAIANLQRRIGDRLPESSLQLYDDVLKADCADGLSPRELQDRLLSFIDDWMRKGD